MDGRVKGVAGVVDDDVELAEAVDCGLDKLVRCVALGQVAAEDCCLTAECCCGLCSLVSVKVVDYNARALLAEQPAPELNLPTRIAP